MTRSAGEVVRWNMGRRASASKTGVRGIGDQKAEIGSGPGLMDEAGSLPNAVSRCAKNHGR